MKSYQILTNHLLHHLRIRTGQSVEIKSTRQHQSPGCFMRSTVLTIYAQMWACDHFQVDWRLQICSVKGFGRWTCLNKCYLNCTRCSLRSDWDCQGNHWSAYGYILWDHDHPGENLLLKEFHDSAGWPEWEYCQWHSMQVIERKRKLYFVL